MAEIFRSAAGREAILARYAEFLEAWPVARREHRIDTGQGETFVIESGPAGAPAVVLLHGSSVNAASWMGDVAAWARRFRVFAVDVIGEPGRSAPSRPPMKSDAHARWLDDVLAGLGLQRAAFVGISLGGWLSLDYAVRRPERVEALVALCPGGVGRHRNVLLWAGPLLLLGPWGRRKLLERIAGGAAAAAEGDVREFGEFMGLAFRHFRPRTETLPQFTDAQLSGLAMPLLAVLGGRDVFIDSPGARDRLARHVPHAEIRYLPEAGHLLLGQTGAIEDFLGRALLA